MMVMRRRMATEAELEEGSRQILEAERRMTQPGMTAFLDVGVGNGSSGVTGFPQPTSPPLTFEPPRGLGGEPLAIGDERSENGKDEGEGGAPSEETELREVEAEMMR